MNRCLIWLPAIAMVFGLPPKDVHGGLPGVLDQVNDQPPITGLMFNANAQFNPAQTFTVGRAGRLSGIEIGVFRRVGVQAPLMVDIARTFNSEPVFGSGGRIATRTVPAIDAPASDAGVPPNFQLLSVDFLADNVAVSPGDQLAIILRSAATSLPFMPFPPGERSSSPPTDTYVWVASGFQSADAYPAGEIFSLQLLYNSSAPYPGLDGVFKTHVAPVPEPGAVWLWLVALASVATLARGRRIASECLADGRSLLCAAAKLGRHDSH